MNPKIIIVEGPDNTGKTVLSKFITNYLNKREVNAIYFHFDYTPSLASAIFDYQYSVFKNMLWNVNNVNATIVFDRSWISELVYGVVIGPGDRLANFNYSLIQDLYKGIETTYIFAQCETSLLHHQQDENHNHAKYTPQQYESIKQNYDRVELSIRKSGAEVTNYNIDSHGNDLEAYAANLSL